MLDKNTRSNMKYNPVIFFTTYNQVSMTKKCLEYAYDLGYDIVVIDDCSNDGTQGYLAEIKANCILKSERKGLTDSWNIAYKYFKGSAYSHAILCNNDVLIPKGAIEGMLSDYPLVVPMCNESGAGYACKEQDIANYMLIAGTDVDTVEDPNFVQYQQNLLHKSFGFKPVKCWTGFMMCMSVEIIPYELPDGNLFDPDNINVGNDDDLAKRVQAYIALGSFIYHFKGTSFNRQIADRDNLTKDYGV